MCTINLVAVAILEIYKQNHLVVPTLIMITLISAVWGIIIKSRENRTVKVQTYAKSIFLNTWLACSIPILLIAFLFAQTGVISNSLVGTLAALFIGVGVFTSGVVFELNYLLVCGIFWWVGACVMAYIDGPFKIFVMAACTLFGLLVPGFILNKKYRNRSK